MEHPLNDVERQRVHFESIAATYYDKRQDPAHLLFKSVMWQHFLKHLPEITSAPHLNVLEPMCGYSEGYKILTQHTKATITYTGFDYSQKLVELGKATHPNQNIFFQDVTTFHPEQIYDVIILIGGLHHVHKHTADVVKNLSKGLRQGGHFIVLEPTYGNQLFGKIRKKIYEKSDFFDAETEQDFAVTELNAHFLREGLSLKRQTYPGLLPYVLYYNPDVFPLLNIGGGVLVKLLTMLEKPFWSTRLAKFFSFATLSCWQKNGM
jgi:SAM-dependent methyltransferase